MSGAPALRSLLFVPADSDRKLARSLDSGADALILDLEDSVAPSGKAKARAMAAAFLATHREHVAPPALYVRINALDSGPAEADLDAVVPAGPAGIMLPKCAGAGAVTCLSVMLAAREALAGLADGAIRILPLVTETPASLFSLGGYAGASQRLAGLAWGVEDLAAAVGAEANRDAAGALTEPFRMVRSLALFAAAAAGLPAIDGIVPAFRDLALLEAEATAARRDGFTGKLAIHPDQVAVINRVFTPSPAAIAEAQAVLAAFAAAGDAGVVAFDGRMLDEPHRRQAERILARAGALGMAEVKP